MIDTHCHLNFPPLLEKINEIVEKSKKVGLTGIVVASSDLEDSKISVELASEYSNFLYASVGIHPQNTDTENKFSINDQLVQLDKLVKLNRDVIVSIGETGLDFSEEKTTGQEELFLGQIKLALKYSLPVIIHARDATDEVVGILKKFPNSYTRAYKIGHSLCGVFHCYSGGKKRIQKILDLPGEWFFGFDGNLTYDEGLQQVIKLIPVDRIVIETDSPYLTPLPYRGQENSPVNLPLIQQKINEIFGKDLTAQILQNSKKLFRI